MAAGCAAVLIWLSVREAWVTDDALIAFRYVDNLIAGRGLTFNTGERIEAFSSSLLVALLAPLRALGANLLSAAKALGVLCTLAELGLVV